MIDPIPLYNGLYTYSILSKLIPYIPYLSKNILLVNSFKAVYVFISLSKAGAAPYEKFKSLLGSGK